MKLRPVPFVADLDAPLLQLSLHDAFTLRHATQGLHVWGGIGSGKTSGTGTAVIAAYLRAGLGGLWLCAKPEEVARAIALAKTNGRGDSLIVFDETQGFNFIQYELARQGFDGIGAVTECLMRVLEAVDAATGEMGKVGDVFWQQTTRQALNYCIPLLYAAHGTVTVDSIIDFVVSAATKTEQYGDDSWCASSFAAITMRKVAENAVVPLDKRAEGSLMDFWFRQFTALPDKTRGSVVASISAKLDRFRHGRMQRCFCSSTTLVPELTFHGAIVVMAMPVLTWNEDGVVGQQLFKLMWQRATESRNGLDSKHRERPVFLYADESQYFVNSKDDEFMSTCRGSRACVVFLSQSLPTYYARLGRDKEPAVQGLVGKFGSMVFHSNSCPQTNQFAAQLVGRGLHRRASASQGEGRSTSYGMNQGGGSSSGSSMSGGSSHSDMGGGSRNTGWSYNSSESASWGENLSHGSSQNWTRGWSEQMDNLIEPNFFSYGLKTGGKPHGGIVSALWFQAGGCFRAAGGANYLVTSFRQ